MSQFMSNQCDADIWEDVPIDPEFLETMIPLFPKSALPKPVSLPPRDTTIPLQRTCVYMEPRRQAAWVPSDQTVPVLDQTEYPALGTVVSRCQAVRFAPATVQITHDDVKQAGETKHDGFLIVTRKVKRVVPKVSQPVARRAVPIRTATDPQETLFKTRMCNSVGSGKPCRHGKVCRFAHSLADLKVSECYFGNRCIYVTMRGTKLVNVPKSKTCMHKHPVESADDYFIRVGLDKFR